MFVWPVVALTGFLLLTAVVIALGTRSTARYELEQQDSAVTAGRAMAAEAVGAAATA